MSWVWDCSASSNNFFCVTKYVIQTENAAIAYACLKAMCIRNLHLAPIGAIAISPIVGLALDILPVILIAAKFSFTF